MIVIVAIAGIGRAVAALHFIRDRGIAAVITTESLCHIVVNRAGVGHLFGEAKIC